MLYTLASPANLFVYLRRRYDQQQIRELNRILKLKSKQVRAQENIRFLHNCLYNHVVPCSIKRRVLKAKPKQPEIIERTFLKDELNKHKDYRDYAKQMYRERLHIGMAQLSFFDKLRFCKLLNKSAARLEKIVRRKKEDQLQRLIRRQVGEIKLQFSTIINLTDTELTDMEKEVLCRGLKFGIPPRVNKEAIQAEFELCWQQLQQATPWNDKKKEECKASLADIALQYGKAKIDRTGFPLNKEHLRTIGKLRKNKDIVITRPDKGNGVVILKREEYVEKMLAILAQDNKFVRIGSVKEHDRTCQQERALQAYLLRAFKRSEITREEYERIRPVGAMRPRMYGVPKVHKTGTPLRPILSMINAPQHEMARWLAEKLQPVINKFAEHTVADTFEFCAHIEEFSQRRACGSTTFMCSFDITSLFTNIPLIETIQICMDSLYRDSTINPPSIPEKLMYKLLLKATTEVEFSFEGVMYRQVDGVAMGSPLGPVLANVFVGYCETKIGTEHWPAFYDRFVDDTFAIFDNEERSQEFHQRLNELHPALKFTVERETNEQLPFMDVCVSKDNQHLVRSIFRKPTFTGLYTRWESFCAKKHKINLIRSLVHRAVKICSPATLKDEFDNLRRILTNNGYPLDVINTTIAKVTDSRNDPTRIVSNDAEERIVSIRLPWIGNISRKFAAQTTTAITQAFPKVRPVVAFTTKHAFAGVAKEALPTLSKSSVVYAYTCSCKRMYVGKTTQRLAERIKQHIPPKLLTEDKQLQTRAADSAITKHLISSRKCMTSEDGLTERFAVLALARNKSHLDVLEGLFIKHLTPELCAQKEHVRVLQLF